MSSPRPSPEFRETRWSLVLRARGNDTEEAQAALSELCRIYWYPIYAFIRRQGISPADAEDLAQDFFRSLLERDDFARADPEKGRLRSYLLGALKHFLANASARSRTMKRGGDRIIVPIDSAWAESRLEREPQDPASTPEKQFDRRWALALLDRTLEQLRTAYEERGKGKQFRTLERFLAWNSGEDFREAADSLRMSESAFRVALHRLRQRYRKALRREIADTVGSEADLEEELASLPSLFG